MLLTGVCLATLFGMMWIVSLTGNLSWEVSLQQPAVPVNLHGSETVTIRRAIQKDNTAQISQYEQRQSPVCSISVMVIQGRMHSKHD